MAWKLDDEKKKRDEKWGKLIIHGLRLAWNISR
jgi:hypothetical protein